MSSIYDGRPPPPTRKERKASGDTMGQRFQEAIPLYWTPSYDEKPKRGLPEKVYLAGAVLVLFVVSSWGLGTLDREYPEGDFNETVVPTLEAEYQRQMDAYDASCLHCYLIGEEYEAWTQSGMTIEEWRVATGVDPEPLSYPGQYGE